MIVRSLVSNCFLVSGCERGALMQINDAAKPRLLIINFVDHAALWQLVDCAESAGVGMMSK